MSHKSEDSRRNSDKRVKSSRERDRDYDRDRDKGRDRNRNRDRDRDRSGDRYRDNDDKHHSRKRYPSEERQSDRKRHAHNKDKQYEWGGSAKREKSTNEKPNKEKEKPNYETTGKLAEDTNVFRGVVIKYSEPEEARKPKRRWRLYPFKGEKALPVLYIHRQSGYLIGRERKIADIAIDHPSCSKQHAAFQFRLITTKSGEVGKTIKQIRPYIMDLGSANGTYLNNKKIEPQRYYELFEKDVLKFGYSSREYVLLHENSADSGEDDDYVENTVKDEPEEK